MGLAARVEDRTAEALRTGALEPIETSSRCFDDRGWPYVVRVVAALGRKPRILEPAQPSARPESSPPNPFQPYDPRIFVADVAPSHVALLNKYPVIAHHLLIVTREFEEQSSLLTIADFEALTACMAELGGLGFYNGGVVAGASQRHKHLQLVPLPLEPDGPDLPFQPLFERAPRIEGLQCVPELGFAHRFAWLDRTATPSGEGARARALHETYRTMLGALDVGLPPHESAYNLLCTSRWLMVVAREREHFGAISVNALGFVGGLLARNEAELELIRQAGVRRILETVARRA